jgi:hypothetical protein
MSATVFARAFGSDQGVGFAVAVRPQPFDQSFLARPFDGLFACRIDVGDESPRRRR